MDTGVPVIEFTLTSVFLFKRPILTMAHYFDVISCGIKQMHAQFFFLFGLHTGGGGGIL